MIGRTRGNADFEWLPKTPKGDGGTGKHDPCQRVGIHMQIDASLTKERALAQSQILKGRVTPSTPSCGTPIAHLVISRSNPASLNSFRP